MKQDFYKDIANYLNRLQETIAKLNHDEINTFINLLIAARDEEKQIFIMGNGGSASTASHFCCDFNKGSSYGFDKRFKFICLNDNVPGMMAYANDVSYDDIFVEQLKNFFQPGDYVIGISGSGNSKNVLKAIEYAKENGGVTIGLTGLRRQTERNGRLFRQYGRGRYANQRRSSYDDGPPLHESHHQ